MSSSRILALDNIIKSNLYEDFEEYALFLMQHKHYSVFNASLIYAQRPGAGFVTTEADWEKHYNRLIKPGAAPIIIMQPFGPVNFVYEENDTYLIENSYDQYQFSLFDLLDFPLDTKVTLRTASEKDVACLTEALKESGVYCTPARFGERLKGQCCFQEVPVTYKVETKDTVKTIVSHYVVPINSNSSPHEQFLALLHEMGHLLCGHVGYDKKNKDLKFADRRMSVQSTEQKEFEAETVCKLVSEHLGIKNDSDKYLKDHLVDGQMPSMSLQIVIEAADKLLKIVTSDSKK